MHIREPLLLLTCFFITLNVVNYFSLAPIYEHEFSTLPIDAQEDIVSHVKLRFSEYRKKQSSLEYPVSKSNLSLFLSPQICYNGEKATIRTVPWPWPEEITFCASKALVDWCLSHNSFYQTTKNSYSLSGGYDLHVSVGCYRINLYNRYMDDFNVVIFLIAIFMIMITSISWNWNGNPPQ